MPDTAATVAAASEASRRPYEPAFHDRLIATLIIGFVGTASRLFLYGLNRTETHGLDRFLELLDSRRDERERQRGLLTVSNHLSVLDDPVIWGVLPFRYHWRGAGNARWSLGSYDICFKNGQSSLLSSVFTYGNTLPTQRLAHSPYGGLFQPTITQCIRLLSDNPLSTTSLSSSSPSPPPSEPYSQTYSPSPTDLFPSPSYYPRNRYSWIHIFPEGMIHQHPELAMRYFKWGVARLILETEPHCPDLVPVWIEGMQDVMSELREWPRPLPRIGKAVKVVFGERVDGEETFGGFRERWRELVRRVEGKEDGRREVGVVESEELRFGEEARKLRIEVSLAVRNEVLKVRRLQGWSDEDPKRSLAETFRREGREMGRREGEMDDRSVVKEM